MTIDWMVAGLTIADILIFKRMLDERDMGPGQFRDYVKKLEKTLKLG